MKVVRTMTDRVQALRLEAMKRYGFGPEVMKETKVCRVCGATAGADEHVCVRCGAELPDETLFDLYKSQHQYCVKCGTVVADRSVFCPECGARLMRRSPQPLRREVV